MLRQVSLRFFESFFRHVWLYLLPVVLLTTLAAVYILMKPPQYMSWGTFYIQDESLLSSLNALRDRGFTFATPSQVTVDEINELFNSTAFMRAVAQQTDLEEMMTADRQTVEQVLNGMRQSVWAQSAGERLVFIGTGNEDPRLAHQLAQATMDTYVQWKINVSQHESAEAQRFFAELVESYRQDLDPIRNSLTEYLIAHPEPIRGERPALESAEIQRIQADVGMAEERVANAQSKEENSRLALTQAESDVRQTYLIFDSPILATEPSSSLMDMAVTFAIFAFAGVFLSIVGVIGGAFLNRSVLFPVDVEQAFSLPVLAAIPEVSQGESEEAQSITQSARPRWSKEQNGIYKDYDITLDIKIPEHFRPKPKKKRSEANSQNGRIYRRNGFHGIERTEENRAHTINIEDPIISGTTANNGSAMQSSKYNPPIEAQINGSQKKL